MHNVHDFFLLLQTPFVKITFFLQSKFCATVFNFAQKKQVYTKACGLAGQAPNACTDYYYYLFSWFLSLQQRNCTVIFQFIIHILHILRLWQKWPLIWQMHNVAFMMEITECQTKFLSRGFSHNPVLAQSAPRNVISESHSPLYLLNSLTVSQKHINTLSPAVTELFLGLSST